MCPHHRDVLRLIIISGGRERGLGAMVILFFSYKKKKRNKKQQQTKQQNSLKGVASANVLQLLGDLRRCSVQLLRHTLLLVGVHAVELLAQISVNHILGTNKGKIREKK